MTIGIIGYGSFGKFIHHLISNYFPHHKVVIFSRSLADCTPFEEVCKSDILFPTVPIHAFEATIKKIQPHLKQETIVVDMCTVKVLPKTVLEKELANHHYICTHPMFGPYSYQKKGNSLEGLNIVLAEHTLNLEQYSLIKHILKTLGLNVLELPAEEHDKLLAETLFLTHLIGQTVSQAGFVRTDIDTVSFGFLMDAVESVKNDTELFLDVYRTNPYCKEVLTKYLHALEKVKKNLDS